MDINSYLRYDGSRNLLEGAENVLNFKFRFCNDHGVLIYQGGDDAFFALGIHSEKIYLEWKTPEKLIEVSNVTMYI